MLPLPLFDNRPNLINYANEAKPILFPRSAQIRTSFPSQQTNKFLERAFVPQFSNSKRTEMKTSRLIGDAKSAGVIEFLPAGVRHVFCKS